MKKIFIFLLLIISLSVQSQIVLSNCNVTQSLFEKFKEDATKLAIIRLYEVQSKDTAQAFVPSKTIDSTLTALVAVYNARNLPARDTVFNMLSFKVFYPALNQLYIATTNVSWTNQWAAKQTRTGFVGIDSILDNYKFTLKSYYDTYTTLRYGLGVFITDSMLNIRALRNRINTFEGVRYTEGGFVGFYDYINGPNIKYQVEPSGNKLLLFDYRWGEVCPSGCEKRRIWTFRIYPDCRVEYLGVSGKLLDFILSNSENNNLNKRIDIYPNPTTNHITLSSTDAFETYNIVDITGKTVLKGTLNSKSEIDVAALPDGLYFLSLYNTSRQTRAVGKFVIKH